MRPLIKIHGGKYYLHSWIISNFPKNYKDLEYCEPFCGGASIFLNKEKSKTETLSDLDVGIISILKALRDEPKEFINSLKKKKYSERTFKIAYNKICNKEFDDYIDRATNEYIVRRMSRGGLKKSFSWSDRKRGGIPGDVNAWNTMIEQLPICANKLQDVNIILSDFKDVIKNWDEENSFIYLDPPYLPDTRTSSDIYEHELTLEDHIDLLNIANNSRGKVLFSGYLSPLYRRMLTLKVDREGKKIWKCVKKDMPNHASQSKTKSRRIECLWKNY